MERIDAPGKEACRVLVVDDQEDNRQVLGLWLGQQGCSVHLAADGSEALRLLGLQPFDIVLTDMWMPQMTGAQLIAAMRADAAVAAIPIVLLSAAPGLTAEQLRGADAFLAKPFAFERLRLLLERYCCPGRAAPRTMESGIP